MLQFVRFLQRTSITKIEISNHGYHCAISRKRSYNYEGICNLEDIFYFRYQGNVAQRKRFPTFNVFPLVAGKHMRNVLTYMARVVINSEYNLSCLVDWWYQTERFSVLMDSQNGYQQSCQNPYRCSVTYQQLPR